MTKRQSTTAQVCDIILSEVLILGFTNEQFNQMKILVKLDAEDRLFHTFEKSELWMYNNIQKSKCITRNYINTFFQ